MNVEELDKIEFINDEYCVEANTGKHTKRRNRIKCLVKWINCSDEPWELSEKIESEKSKTSN